MRLRSKWRLPVVGFLAFAALVLPAAAASAQPVDSAASAPTCTHPRPYPPTPNATVQASTSKAVVGATIEVSGVNYCPDEDVAITIDGQNVGTGHTDGQGTFDPHVVVPGPAGDKKVCGIGASGLSTDRDCLVLTGSGVGGVSTTAPGGSSGGGTAFTGVEIALLCAFAVLLLAGGVAFSTAGRAQKSVPLS